MKRERQIETLSGVMSQRAYEAAKQKLGIKEAGLINQHRELGAAGGTNDFHDNAAFDEANRLIDVMGIDVAKWSAAVHYPQIIEPRSETDTVQLGNRVDLELTDFNDRFTRHLLGPVDAILFPDEAISYESPLGKAILGNAPGAEVTYEAQRRLYKVKIHNVLPGLF
jgi:transcription elongation factor GreA